MTPRSGEEPIKFTLHFQPDHVKWAVNPIFSKKWDAVPFDRCVFPSDFVKMSSPIYLGPLTTRVALPVCTASYTGDPGYPYTTDAVQVKTTCYPPGYAVDGAYSPGVCPYSWTSACTFTSGEDFVRSALSAQETGVECCPVGGFTCSWGIAYCRSGDVNVKPILVVYQSTDSAISNYFAAGAFATFTADAGSTTTSVSTFTLTTSASASSTGALGSPINNRTASGGLSPGAKIAIGVSIPLAAIIIGMSVWIFFLIRKKRRLTGGHDHDTVDEFPTVINVGSSMLPNKLQPRTLNSSYSRPTSVPMTQQSRPISPYSNTMMSDVRDHETYENDASMGRFSEPPPGVRQMNSWSEIDGSRNH